MQENSAVFLKCNFNDEIHCRSVICLINSYMSDPMGGNLSPLSPSAQNALIQGLRNESSTEAFLLQYESHIVAGAICFRGFSTFSVKPQLNIHDLMVLPSYRKCGFGTTILNEIKKWASENSFGRLTLEVRSDNDPAKRLYSKIGFSPCVAPMEFWVHYL